MNDSDSICVLCELGIIGILKTDTFIKDYCKHLLEDTDNKSPAIVVGFRQGDEHPKGSGNFEYIGEIAVRDNMRKTGSDEDTLSAYVKHVNALFIGINRRTLRQQIMAIVNPTLTDEIFVCYGAKLLGDGERVTVRTTRIHPIHINLIATVTSNG